jgi:hypothetical protein
MPCSRFTHRAELPSASAFANHRASLISVLPFQKSRCKSSDVTHATIIHFQGGPNDGSRQKWAKPVMPVIRVAQLGETIVEFEGDFFTDKVLIGWALYEVHGKVAQHRGFEGNASCYFTY